RREEVEVLPDRSADRAGNSHVVLEPRPAASHRLLDQGLDDRSAFRPEMALVAIATELVVGGDVADDEPAEPPVAHQDVGAEAEDEVGYTILAGREHGVRNRICRGGLEEQVGGTADLERGVRSEGLVAAQMRSIQARGEPFYC